MAWDIVKKIKQLLALAESTDYPAEAEAVMIKVRQLLDEHGLSLLGIHYSVKHNDPVEVDRDAYWFWNSDCFMRKVCCAAATFYGVEIVWVRIGNKHHVHVIGRESCRVAYRLMVPYLRRSIHNLARKGVKAGRYRSESSGATDIGKALALRMYRLHAERQPTTPQGKSAANMLVPYDEIEFTLHDQFPEARARGLVSRKQISAYARQDAEKIPLATQVTEEIFLLTADCPVQVP